MLLVFDQSVLWPVSPHSLGPCDAMISGSWVAAYCTPKLRIVAFGYHGALTIGAQDCSDLVEGRYEFLGICRVYPVLWCFTHRDNEDIAIMAVERQIRIVDD